MGLVQERGSKRSATIIEWQRRHGGGVCVKWLGCLLYYLYSYEPRKSCCNPTKREWGSHLGESDLRGYFGKCKD